MISVPATKMYYEPTKPFPGASGEIAERPYNDVFDIDDMQGKRDSRVVTFKRLDLSRRWSVGATFLRSPCDEEGVCPQSPDLSS